MRLVFILLVALPACNHAASAPPAEPAADRPTAATATAEPAADATAAPAPTAAPATPATTSPAPVTTSPTASTTDPTPDGPATATASPAAAPGTGGPLEALAELAQGLAAQEPQGGGSIRSKLDAEVPRADPQALEARVVSVHAGAFPNVALRLKVLRAATAGPGAALKANAALVVVPHFALAGGRPVLTDPTTATNAGAWYLRAGDRVSVRLTAEHGRFWEAERIERR